MNRCPVEMAEMVLQILSMLPFFLKARQLTVQMMQNPQILAALQERLDGLVDTPTGYIERYKFFFFPPTLLIYLFCKKNIEAYLCDHGTIMSVSI